MTEAEIFRGLALALAIGLLLGLERGWHGREQSEGDRIAGIRTFALSGLLGGVCGLLATTAAPLVLAAATLAFAGLLATGYWAGRRADGDIGMTTEIALMLSFVLGAVAMLGPMAPAAAAAVVAALLLSMKAPLHRWLARIDRAELAALMKLAVLSVVILPLLPDRGYGPGAAINPHEIWWAVVIVAGLSFFGYVAIRLAGTNAGILATGLFGGLASSTSATLALARMTRKSGALAPMASAGIVLAGSVTFLRILVLAAIFAPALAVPLALPMGVMAATGLAGGALVWALAGGPRIGPGDIDKPANPLELAAALSFGAVLVIVLLGVHYLRDRFGTGGAYVAAALSGMTDVDALTITMSRLTLKDMALPTAATAIFIAAAVNTAVKGAISLVAGNVRLGRRVCAVYAGVIAAGGAALWFGG